MVIRGKGWSVSSVVPPIFFSLFLPAEGKQHREWEGAAIFFGIVALEVENQLSLRVGMSAGGGVEFLWWEIVGNCTRNAQCLRQHLCGCCCWTCALGGHGLHKGVERFLKGGR